jgi:hypothetical protein
MPTCDRRAALCASHPMMNLALSLGSRMISAVSLCASSETQARRTTCGCSAASMSCTSHSRPRSDRESPISGWNVALMQKPRTWSMADYTEAPRINATAASSWTFGSASDWFFSGRPGNVLLLEERRESVRPAGYKRLKILDAATRLEDLRALPSELAPNVNARFVAPITVICGTCRSNL